MYMATSLPYIIVDLLGILLMILKSGFPCMNCEFRFYGWNIKIKTQKFTLDQCALASCWADDVLHLFLLITKLIMYVFDNELLIKSKLIFVNQRKSNSFFIYVNVTGFFKSMYPLQTTNYTLYIMSISIT